MPRPPQKKSAIGLIGLAAMGANLARNIASCGFSVSVFNRTTEKTEKFIKDFAKDYPLKSTNPRHTPAQLPTPSLLHGTHTLKDFVASLETPRKIILLVKAGAPVDEMIAKIAPILDKNDILIDCGNSHFRDTERRQQELAKKSLHLIGCGISGGEEGALHGPSLMPGGDTSAWEKIHPIFEKIAAKPAYRQAGIFSGKPCVTHIGPGGSGHFVKMVHNGIEYAIMQLIAESYDILKNLGKFTNPELSKIFSGYNKNPNLKSFLLEITAKIFTKHATESQISSRKNGEKIFLIDLIKDSAGQKGTGKWTTELAHNLGVYTPTINTAVDARIVSGETGSRTMCQKFFTLRTAKNKPIPATKKHLVKQVEDSLELATILCYEQGVSLIIKADKEFNWNLNMQEIMRIWQGGCIIRSQYLKKLEIAFSQDKKSAVKIFKEVMKNLGGEKQRSWRKLLALALENAIPVPALYSTLNYYDSYAKPHLPQNLIQAQRDFFGAHGYERIDKPGTFHTEW